MLGWAIWFWCDSDSLGPSLGDRWIMLLDNSDLILLAVLVTLSQRRIVVVLATNSSKAVVGMALGLVWIVVIGSLLVLRSSKDSNCCCESKEDGCGLHDEVSEVDVTFSEWYVVLG